MFRESLRISISMNHDSKAEEDKIKKVCKRLNFHPSMIFDNILLQFQEQEKKRYMQEQQRFETKHMVSKVFILLIYLILSCFCIF